MHPARTQGGYRLFRLEDVERLRTILRLQRDEFLPLRVIREELAAPRRGRKDARRAAGAPAGLKGRWSRPSSTSTSFCERPGADPDFVRQLVQVRILRPVQDGRLHEADVDIVSACTRLLRYGIEPRNLGKFRSAADNEAALIAGRRRPTLRSRLPTAASAASRISRSSPADAIELSQLLFWRALRSEISTQ